MIKNLISLLSQDAFSKCPVVPDYSQVSSTAIVALYDEAYATLHRYVEFSLDELHQRRPGFMAFTERAMAVQVAHDFFLKHYAHYLGLVRELDRCDIEPRPLRNSVRSIIDKFRSHYSFEKYDTAVISSA